jgi:uncharacterized protein (TIRG00374 family)
MVSIDSRLKAAVVGFIAAIGVFAVLFWLIDVERFLQELGRADPVIIGIMVIIAFGWLTAWSLALRTVLGVLDVKLTVKRSFMAYASALFSNNITPFGQAGGEPVAAVFISRISSVDYDTGLASIASVDAINFVPSITYALLGLAYYAIFLTLGEDLVLAAIVVVVLAIVVPVILYLGWKYRYLIERHTISILTPLLGRIGELVPRLSPPDPESIEQYVENFFGSIERITSDRQAVSTAIAFSALGWFLQIVLLWLSFISIGYRIPLTVVLLVIPVGNVASIAPLPGGLGAIDVVFVALLTSLTGINFAVATAAVVLYRGLVYGLPTLVGGGTIALLSVRASAST